MSRTVSPEDGRKVGLERVCRVLGSARSTHYYRLGPAATAGKPTPKKRGPKPKVSDEELLALIRVDLDESPFEGEGHRKVWARLRLIKRIRVSRTRVLRLTRANGLLSPYRGRKGAPTKHDGRITTDTPNEMWGTDGSKIQTVDDGVVWVFTAIDHFNAECVGVHVTKRGDRFAALEPILQGIGRFYGKPGKNVATGLAVRMDHGCQYTSDYFLDQVKHFGMRASFAYLHEPETNGVAERFFKTLKEQIIHGRIYRNIEELRAATVAFVALYNNEWRVEKNGFTAPMERRSTWLAGQMKAAA
jgi:transposase InsO family protein